jgi:hypothetical protein
VLGQPLRARRLDHRELPAAAAVDLAPLHGRRRAPVQSGARSQAMTSAALRSGGKTG